MTRALIVGITASRITRSAAVAHVWWTLHLMSLGATLLGLLLLIGTTAVIRLRTQLFPRWFAIASAALALLSIAGAFTIGFATPRLGPLPARRGGRRGRSHTLSCRPRVLCAWECQVRCGRRGGSARSGGLRGARQDGKSFRSCSRRAARWFVVSGC